MLCKNPVGATIVFLSGLFAWGVAEPQVSDPLEGISPPLTRTNLVVDTQVGGATTYGGRQGPSLPRAGDQLEVKLYLPEAAGQMAFGVLLNVIDEGSHFTENFLLMAKEASDGETPASVPFRSIANGGSTLFANAEAVPGTGLIATFLLRAKRDQTRPVKLRLRVTIALYSTTPPTRLWQLQTEKPILWI